MKQHVLVSKNTENVKYTYISDLAFQPAQVLGDSQVVLVILPRCYTDK
jgi:hypothetical protein